MGTASDRAADASQHSLLGASSESGPTWIRRLASRRGIVSDVLEPLVQAHDSRDNLK